MNMNWGWEPFKSFINPGETSLSGDLAFKIEEN
jgi:hypothetical protein